MRRRLLVLGFPGQGSQKTGMGKALAERYPRSAGQVFEEASSVLPGLFPDIVWRENASLNQTNNAQPAILATSIAVLAALRERHGFEVSSQNTAYLIGHSLGEYSALVAGGSLSLSDALLLVHRRGEYMQRACDAWGRRPAMAAVLNLTWKEALEIQAKTPCGLVCEAANNNGAEQVVLSGCEEGLDWGIHYALEHFPTPPRRRAVKIKVSCPFHSSVMRAAADWFAEDLARVTMQSPRVPLILGENTSITQNVEEIRASLVRGIYSPVQWGQCLDKLRLESGSNGELEFREIGGSTLRFGLKDWKHVGKPVRADVVEDVEEFTF